MISCVFNNWAEDYVTKYTQSCKLKRIILKLNVRLLHIRYKHEGYQNVLTALNSVDEFMLWEKLWNYGRKDTPVKIGNKYVDTYADLKRVI